VENEDVFNGIIICIFVKNLRVDHFPEPFISVYNEMLEAIGILLVIYEISE